MLVNLQLTSVLALTKTSMVNRKKQKHQPAGCLCRRSTCFQLNFLYPSSLSGSSCDIAELYIRMGGNLVNLVAFTICSSTGIATSSPPSPGFIQDGPEKDKTVEWRPCRCHCGVRGQYELTAWRQWRGRAITQTTSGELFCLFFRQRCRRGRELLDVRTMLVEALKGW